MRWINLWIKNFAAYRVYLHEIAFNLVPQQLFCTKAKKYQGITEKKHDFEMSMHSCRMCCTMVHFIGVPIIKSCSSSLTT